MEIWLQMTEKYLGIPVKTAGPGEEGLRTLEMFLGEQKLMEFQVPAYAGTPDSIDYYAYINMEAFAGEGILIKGDFPEPFFSSIILSDRDENAVIERPELHFTAKRGWINDPNGLVYRDGAYHLYFQHNPMNTEWENMSWGHAVSRDLLHWDYCDTVLYPDEYGTAYSGCGLANGRELLGLPKDALLFFYTAAAGHNEWSKGKKPVQRLAYSLDGGMTFKKHPDWQLGNMAFENRDPKVFEDPSGDGSYVMVLFLDGNDFAIFRSDDLEHWERTQTLTLPEAWECPDLFRLQADDGTWHWVFWSADGFYFLGDFDGKVFTARQGRREAYGTRLPYAAQTYSGVKGRTVSVAWLRTRQEGRPYRGAMALPRELSLAEVPPVGAGRKKMALPAGPVGIEKVAPPAGSGEPEKEYRMRLAPVRELEEAWEPFRDIMGDPGQSGNLGQPGNLDQPEGAGQMGNPGQPGNPPEAVWESCGRPFCVKASLDSGEGGAGGVSTLELCGETWSIDPKRGAISFRDMEYKDPDGMEIRDFTVIADRGIVEITANHDIIYLVYETDDYALTGTVRLCGGISRAEAASLKG